MEEDEEDLYSEMQLEEGRRRSINSHNTLKVHTETPYKHRGQGKNKCRRERQRSREDGGGGWQEGQTLQSSPSRLRLVEFSCRIRLPVPVLLV